MTKLINYKYLLGVLVAVFFVSRLVFLTTVPIFNDESTYLRMAKHQVKELDHKAYSLQIGKEPLLPYIYGVTGEMSGGNYLVAGRLVNVFFGLFTLLGLFYFARDLFGKKAAFFAGIIYIFSPFNLFFDRLALMDGAISTIAIWSLYATYLLFKYKTWFLSISLGVIAGLGIWIKGTSLFYVFLPLFAYSFYYFFDKSKTKDKQFVAILLGGSLTIAAIFFLLLYSNEFYPDYQNLMKQYTYPYSFIFGFPIGVWFMNFWNILQWLFFYMIPIIPILAIFYFIFNWRDYKKYYLIVLWLILPFAYEVIFGKTLTSRHVLLLSIPIIIFAASYLAQIRNKNIVYLLLGIFIVISLIYNSVLFFRPQNLQNLYIGSAKADIYQYFYGYSSGYGVQESIDYLLDKSKEKPLMVFIRNDHGNPEDAVIGALTYERNIVFTKINSGVDQVQMHEEINRYLNEVGDTTNVYFVSRGAYYFGLEEFFVDETKFEKPNDTEFVGVYKLGIKDQ